MYVDVFKLNVILKMIGVGIKKDLTDSLFHVDDLICFYFLLK